MIFKEEGELYTKEEMLNNVRWAIENKEKEDKERKERYKKILEEEEERRQYFNSGNSYYNISLDRIETLSNEVNLTYSELSYFFYLGSFVKYTEKDTLYSKLIKSHKDKDGMKSKDIRKELNFPKRDETFYNFIDKLLNHGIVKKDEKGCYWMNNFFIFKGKYVIGGNIMTFETKEIRKGIKQMKPNHFGILIKLLPYVSCRVPALVRNPSETNLEKIEYIQSVREICEIVGISRNAFNQLWNLRIDNKCLMFQLRNNKGKRYGINFNILHRGEINKIKDNCTNAKLNIDEML